MASETARRWTALIGSFGVYLVPLVGPHAFWLVGEALVIDLTSNRSWAWRGADLAVAVLAQAATWALLRWSLRGSAFRTLSWAAVIPLVAALNLAYLETIPSYFLIEPDTSTETTTWAEHCFVPGVSLMPIRTGVTQTSTGNPAWWVQRPNGGFAVMRVPDCSLIDGALPTPTLQPGGRVDFLIGLQFATREAAAIAEKTETGSGARTWSVLVHPDSSLQTLEPPPDVEGPPILSRNGEALAWMQRVAGSGPPVLERVLVRAIARSTAPPDVDIDLAPLGPASYTLLDLDMSTQDVTLWRNDRPVLVGFDGTAHPLPFDVDESDIQPQATTYLRLADGWVAWDAYRDAGPYQLAWSINGRTGVRRTNAGRSITAAAVDPKGTFIAVSETTALSIGNARDVVSVIRTDTGAEVFRKYLPRYARSTVVFFEGGLFGYSDLDGTHILTM